MDDSLLGTRNKRGDWSPNAPVVYPPLFVWPPRPIGFVKWFVGLPGYLFPWTVFYMAVAVLTYAFLTPSAETTKTFEWGWLSFLLARNLVYVLVFYGGMHFMLYMKRSQQSQFKFSARWPDTDNPTFLFRDQVRDNMFWTLASGVPVWTAYEALMLWLFSNGYIPFMSWAEHPYYNAALMIAIPWWREFHFFCAHRLLHVPVLYRYIHKLHHNNVNILPWSGMAMHPIEHILYLSVGLIHIIVPSNPLHMIFTLSHAGLTPAQGHVGFSRIGVGGVDLQVHTYPHYLHHKYFECNYADGTVPLDKWFGSFHDGTPEAQARMDARFLKQAEKAAAKKRRASA